jgi:predicted nucleic acid-binding protein
MYLIDTNVISELRKKRRANTGVRRFFREATDDNCQLYLSVITLGELRRGVELIRHRGDRRQAKQLESWLDELVSGYVTNILDFSATEAQVCGRLRVPRPANVIDKQIAATALSYDLTLVTRNVSDFRDTGARLLDPFEVP